MASRALTDVVREAQEAPYSWHDNYAAADRRVGLYVEINGVDVYSQYNADMYSMAVTPATITKTTLKKVSRSQLRTSGLTHEIPVLTVGFYVGGPTKEEAMDNVNRLLALCDQCEITTEEERYVYDCSLSSVSVAFTEVEHYYDVALTFDYIKHLEIEEVEFTCTGESTRSVTFENEGTVESGAYVELHPTSSGNYTILGVKVNDLSPGDTFIIDGLEGIVSDQHGMAFDKTDFTKFPKIQPDMNTVTVNLPCRVVLRWYPTFRV